MAIAGALWQHAQIAFQRGDLARCALEAPATIQAGDDFARRLATPWLVLVLTEQGHLDERGRSQVPSEASGPLPERA